MNMMRVRGTSALPFPLVSALTSVNPGSAICADVIAFAFPDYGEHARAAGMLWNTSCDARWGLCRLRRVYRSNNANIATWIGHGTPMFLGALHNTCMLVRGCSMMLVHKHYKITCAVTLSGSDAISCRLEDTRILAYMFIACLY
jgi:hypothetical protein